MIDPDTFHDLQEEVIYWAKEYMQENPLILAKTNYLEEIINAIFNIVQHHWQEFGIFQSWSEEETLSFIRYHAKENTPKRYYARSSFPHNDYVDDYDSSCTNTNTPPSPNSHTQENQQETQQENQHQENQHQIQKAQQRVKELQEIDKQNPKQGTKEWLNQRHNMITASSVSKLFNSQAQYQSIIKEKSAPNLRQEYEQDNTRGPAPLVWGHKYEPISVQIYEDLTNETVLSLGCIPHAQYPYLGASPDGIISPFQEKEDSGKRAGRLLEIKNPISRIIDGIPSETYWIQQQIQMEVCDMDGCDFLETQFKEMDEQAFYETSSDTVAVTPEEHLPNMHEEYLGVIAHYQSYEWGDKYPKIKYIYLPPLTSFVSHPFLKLSDTDSDSISDSILDSISHTDFEAPAAQELETQEPAKENEKAWMDTKTKQIITDLQAHINQQIPQTHPEYPNYTIMKKEYWKLSTLSLVYVPRNKEWFQASQSVIQKAWETILENRAQAPPPTSNNVTNYFTQIVKEP
jgi:hypothetical protein